MINDYTVALLMIGILVFGIRNIFFEKE